MEAKELLKKSKKKIKKSKTDELNDKSSKKRKKEIEKQKIKKATKSLNKKDKSLKEPEESKWICPSCTLGDDGSEMIGCDRCEYWYHFRCVKLTKAPSKNSPWFCKNCLVKKPKIK